MSVQAVALFTFGFLCGSIPFAVLIGRYGLKTDIRNYGDGNPGAFNVLRAGGIIWGGLAIVLDTGKAALPVGFAYYVIGIEDWSMVFIALAPPIGHAFSPFLQFSGGKAIASSGGVLIGISLVELPLVAIVMLIFWYTSFTSSGWAVMFTMGSLLIYMTVTGANTTWFTVVIALALLLALRHRVELIHLPQPKMSPLLRPLVRLLYPTREAVDDHSDSVHHDNADRC